MQANGGHFYQMYLFIFIADGSPDNKLNVKFVQDTTKFWYKPEISREQGKSWAHKAERVFSFNRPTADQFPEVLLMVSQEHSTRAYFCVGSFTIDLQLNSHMEPNPITRRLLLPLNL